MESSMRLKIARTFLIVGILCGLPSIWETLAFSWDPTFSAPLLRYGPSHTNYHAFREFTLTVGVIAVMLWVMFQPPTKRTRTLWVAMALAGFFYYGGWWLPWPLFGFRAPTIISELVHATATFFSILSILISRASFDVPMSRTALGPAKEVKDGNK
jgi:hypothetical protein